MADVNDLISRLSSVRDQAGFGTSPTQAPAGSDYTRNFDASRIRSNPYFLDDLRRYYESRGISGKTDDELFNLLLDDSNVRAANTFAPFVVARGSWSDAASENDISGTERLARLKQVADLYPSVFSEGGRSLGEALPSIAKGAITDPLNLVGVGVGIKAGAAGLRAAAEGATALRSTLAGAAAGARSGAIAEGTLGAVAGGIADYGDQATNVELGLQQDVSATRLLESAAVSGIISGTLGSVLGGISGGAAARSAHTLAGQLRDLGYSADQIAALDIRQATNIAKNGIASPEAAPTPTEPGTELSPEETAKRIAERDAKLRTWSVDVRLASLREVLREYNARLSAERDQMVTDGVHDLKVQATTAKLAQIDRLLGVYPRLEAERLEISKLIESNDAAKRTQGERRAAALEKDLADLQGVYLANDVPASGEKFINDFLARQGLLDPEVQGPPDGRTPPQTPPPIQEGPPLLEGPTPTTGSRPEDARPNAPETVFAPAQVSETYAPSAQPTGVPPTQATPEPEPAPATPAAPAAPPPKARPAIVTYALSQGVDLAEVTPTGNRGFVTRADVDAYLASRTSPDPSPQLLDIASSVEATLARLEQSLGDHPDLIQRIMDDDDAFISVFREINGVDETRGRAALQFLRGALDVDLNDYEDLIPQAESPIVFNKTENRRIEARARELMRDLSMGETIARAQAEQEAIRARSVPSGRSPRSGTQSVESRAVTESQARSAELRAERDAKMGVSKDLAASYARIQSFMKRGTTFNPNTLEEYSITGSRGSFSPERASTVSEVPRPDLFSLEEAKVLATKNKSIIAFMADSGTISPVDTPGFAKKGSILYMDPRSGKAFTDWRNIYQSRNEPIPASPPAIVRRQLEMVGLLNAAPDAIENLRAATSAGARRPDLINQAVEALKSDKPPTVDQIIEALKSPSRPAVQLPPLERNGKRLLLIRNEPNPDGSMHTRLATADDVRNNLTAQHLIGTKGPYSDLSQWTVKYVPSSVVDRATERLAAARTSTPEPTPRLFADQPTPLADYNRLRLDPSDLTEADWAALEAAASLMKDPDAAAKWLAKARASNTGISGEALNRLIVNIETGGTRAFNKTSKLTPGWPSSPTGQQSMIRLLSSLYSLQTKIAPNGILLPEADRAAVAADAGRIFKKYGKEQVAAIQKVLARLNSPARPAFGTNPPTEAAALTNSLALSGDRVGLISVGPDIASGDIPVASAVFHELAHWAYINILSPTDRLSFWQSMGKYYDPKTGSLDVRTIATNSPIRRDAANAVVGVRNALDNPQEFFANQFMMWATRQVAPTQAEVNTLWKRVARIIKALVDRFFAKDAIDPDLEPLFSKILPDAERAERAVADDLSDIPSISDELIAAIPSTDEPVPDAPPVPARVRSDVLDPASAAPRRTGPADDYLAAPLDQAIAGQPQTLERKVRQLHSNYNKVADFRRRWQEALLQNDTGKAISVAQDQLSYLRGSYLTVEQADSMRRIAAKKTGTPLQPQTNRTGVYAPYAASPTHRQAGLSALIHISKLLRGAPSRHIDGQRAIDSALSSELSDLVSTGGARVSLDYDQIGQHLLEWYASGVRDGEGGFLPGTSGLDFMSLQQKMLNTAYERLGINARVDAPNSVRGDTTKPSTSAKVGHFARLNIGDRLRTRGTTGGETWTVTRFERSGDEQVAIIRNDSDATEAVLNKANSKSVTRTLTAPDPTTIAAKAAAEVSATKAAKKAAKRALKDSSLKRAKSSRSAPSTAAPAPSDAPSTRTMSEAELLKAAETDTTLAERAADELANKEAAEPTTPPPSPTYADTPTADLSSQLAAEFRSGSLDATDLAAELRTRGVPTLVTPSDPLVATAISREIRETIGAGRHPGVPASAPSVLKDLLLAIDHRDHRTRYIARTLAYRILAVSGSDLPTNQDIAFAIRRTLGSDKADAPLSPTSSTFNDFRSALRNFASALNTGDANSTTAVIKQLAVMLRRLDENGDVIERIADFPPESADRLADEWFADELAMRFEGSQRTPNIPDNEDGRAAEALVQSAMDRIGYIVNGLLGERARQSSPRLTWYGDLFGRTSSPSSDLPQARAYSPLEASRLLDTLDQLPEGHRLSIEQWSGLKFDGPIRPVQFLDVASATKVTAIKPTGGDYGTTIQLKSTPSSSFTSWPVDSLPTAEQRAIAREMLDNIEANGSYAELLYALSNKSPTNQLDIDKSISDAIDHEVSSIETLQKYGVAVPLQTPYVIKASAPFRADATVSSVSEFTPLIASLSRAISTGTSTAPIEGLRRATTSFAEEFLAEGKNGGKLGVFFDRLADEYTTSSRAHATLINGREVARNLLQAAGYDSIVDGDTIHVFSPTQLKAIDDPDFTLGLDIPEPEAPIYVSGHLARLFSSADDDIPLHEMPIVLGPVAKAEPFRPIVDFMSNFAHGRRATPEDLNAVVEFNRIQLRTNASRLARSGLNHLASWFDTHFQEVSSSFAKMLYGTASKPGPLSALQTLPDASGFVKHHLRTYFRRATGDTQLLRRFGVDQPQSHKNILSALQRGRPSDFSNLTPSERAVATTIRTSLQSALAQLKDAGAMVGDLGPNYFPQIWNPTKIQKNRDAFKNDLRNFLIQEARQDRRDPPADLDRLVDVLYLRMSDEVQGGILNDTHGSGRSSSADHLDYSRMFDLDRVTDGRQLLGKYLEDDLTTHLVKYFDGVALRLAQVKKFGNASHGYFDYLKVIQSGRNGIVDLLTKPRVETHSTNAMSSAGEIAELQFAESFAMPFANRPDQAQAAVDTLLKIHANQGPQAARDFLVTLGPPDPARAGAPSHVYMRRVDAIIAGLNDIRVEPTPKDVQYHPKTISQDEMRFIENVLHVSNRKTLLGSGGRVGVTASRVVRKFNSVTLLGWTLLSSLGDPGLALVRSGDMRAFLRGVTRLRLDQDYAHAIRNVGLAMESILHDRMANLWGSPDGRFTNAFFTATGLTPWTDTMRNVAGAVALETFGAAQAKALRNYAPGVPVAQQSRAFKASKRILDRYGLGEFATMDRTIHSMLEDDRVRVALHRFADDSIFSPNPNQIPLWAQTPLGAVLAQLKSFPLMAGRMARELLFDDVRVALYHARGLEAPAHIRANGDLRRGLMFLTAGPLIGAGVIAMKDIVQGRGGEGSSHETRERRFSKWAAPFGVQEFDNEDIDAVAGWAIEGITMFGGLGLLAEMIHDVLDQADNGQYGLTRASQTVFGPTAGLVVDGWTVGTGVYDWFLDTTPNGNAAERAAARATIRRVPVAGGVGSFRESLVDTWAGESSKAAAKQAAKDNNAASTFNPVFLR